MEPALALYNLAAAGAAAALPAVKLASVLSGRWGELWPRVGLYRFLAPARPGPRVWLQAVSVGELAVARSIAAALLELEPRAQITVTTSTAKGMEQGPEIIGSLGRVAPFPLDLPWAVLAAARKIRPQVYASLETELWPGLTARLTAAGARCLLLNGRLSPRAFPRYRRVRPLIRPTLRRLSALSMIGDEDAKRVVALGADPARVFVEGNAKYAGLIERTGGGPDRETAARLDLGPAPLVVAGSVRSGEEEAVLGAFRQTIAIIPDAVLLVAPRHVERAPRWLARGRAQGLVPQLYSDLSSDSPRRPDCNLVVMDVMGRLMGSYPLARTALVGASLVPLGGQNPMEPAAWGVPVCFGPDMADFADAAGALLASGAATKVEGAGDLAAAWARDLARPEAARERGAAGREVVARWSGAARAAARRLAAALAQRGGEP